MKLACVDGQLEAIIRDKILESVAAPLPEFTRRSIPLPGLPNKARCVIGMRRTGKTTFLHQCRSDFLRSGARREELVYFNFEDERLWGLTADQLSLIVEAHARAFPDAALHPRWFFDEIQRIPGWESFVRRILDEGRSEVFLSGSSAKMLSREIASAMRGRGWEIVVYPFSFAEFLAHHRREISSHLDRLTRRQSTALDHHFAEYLVTGGFPEGQAASAPERFELVAGYVDVVLLRDVIERHGITQVVALRHLVRRLLGNPAGLFSVQKFWADLKSQHIPVSRETLHEMLAALEDAFLLHTVAIATDSEKRRHVNPRKVYPADPTLIRVFDRSGRSQTGHALESLVLVELLRRRYEVAYVRTQSGGEVDFLARNREGRSWLIQVCADLADPDTLTREVRAMQDALMEHPRATPLLLVLESRLLQPEVPKPIRVRSVWEWMLAPDIFDEVE